MHAAVAFDTSYYPVAVVSCMFFLATFKYVCPSLSAYFCPKFKTLPVNKQVYWLTSINSSLHAVITSCMCVYALMYEEELRSNPIWHNSATVKTSCAIVSGYMASDAILMLIHYRLMGDPYTLLHHAASVYAYYYVMTYGVYVYFANFRLIAEFSTPWVNNRWFLDVMGKKGTKAYLWNGIILTTVFFFCRILTMPWCWYKIYDVYGTEAYLRTGNIKYVLVISCGVLDILNLYWFFKLLRGVHKTLSTKMDSNKNIAQKAE